MFVKLLKWEFCQTGRVMLPVLGGALILYGGALGAQALGLGVCGRWNYIQL